jgi:fibronectin-binding autotransporter adhesin
MMNHLQGVGHTFQKLTRNSVGRTFIFALSLLLTSATARATNEIWIVNTGTFNTPSNWNTGLTPVDGDSTLFTNETSFTVSLSGNTANLFSTTISNHTGAVTINANGFTWQVTNTFRVGSYDSTSTVFVTSGTLAVAGVIAATGQLRIGDTVTNVPGVFSAGTMTIVGGTVAVDAGIVGATTNSVGTLIVTGTGVYRDGGTSSPSTLTIGANSAMNRLIVTNGGQLFVSGTLTVGGSIGLTNNSMLLSGPTSGATLTMAGDVKYTGNGGLLVISNGAKLFETGSLLFGNACNDNTGVVTGVGSSLIAQGSVQIGTGSAGGTNNLFTVQDGALFNCGGTFAFGNNSFHIHDGFVMGGVGSPSTGLFVVVRSASNSTNHDSNFMTFTNSFSTINYLNPQGPLETIAILGKATVVLTNSISIGVPAANSNSVSMGGVSSTLFINGGTLANPLTSDNVGGISVGGAGGNSVIITNGGKLISGDGTLGASTALNTGIVSGVSSVWSNFTTIAGFTNTLIVGTGAAGSNNFLGVFNGGSLYNNGTLAIGNNGFTAVVNTVNFGGPGLAVTVVNGGSINIGAGNGSFGNSLNITNATVSTVNLNVGNSGATNNSLVLKSGTLSVGFMRVRPTNTVTFSGGVLSAGGSTVDTLADNNGPFVVGDTTVASGAVYEMAAGDTGYHNFNNGGLAVTNNATLRGSGTLVGNVGVSGVFSPGIGGVGSIFSSNDLVFGSSAVLNYDLGTVSDTATVNGNLGLGGTINVTAGPGFGVGTYTLFTHTNTVTGTLTVGSMPGGFTGTVSTNTLPLVQLIVITGGGGDAFTTWQNQYFGCTACPQAQGNADPLGKGMSNTNQFLAGFNPTVASAYVHVTAISKTNSAVDVRVDYLGASGNSSTTPPMGSRTNVLEFTAGTAGSYNTNTFASTGITNILSGGTGLGTLTNMVDPGGATNKPSRYYRIRVLVP